MMNGVNLRKSNYVFDIYGNENFNGLVAKTDMVVLKKGVLNGDGSFSPWFRRDFKYKEFELQRYILLSPRSTREETGYSLYSTFTIEEGYHAYYMHLETYLKVIKAWSATNTMQFAGRFIIPEGTKYYLGNMNDIVASQIIYTGLFDLNESILHDPGTAVVK